MTQTNMICVNETPLAAFDASSTVVETSDANITFTNSSIGASSYSWDFGDESTISNDVSPQHDYATADFGNYLVTLIATTPMGCVDTAYKTIQVSEYLLFFIPNTFTPDGNDFNQTFKPIFTAGFDPFSYTLSIYNRWGEIVWESYDAAVGWDGTYGLNGIAVQDDVYIYNITFGYKDSAKKERINGHIVLIK